jgi:Na+/H+-dicarboxylate symporter
MASAAQETDKRESRLQWWMLLGFGLGLALGLIAHFQVGDAQWVKDLTTYVTAPFGQLFLRLLFMLVIPLLVSALIVGIAEMGEIRSLRRVGIRTLVLTVFVSSIAVLVSLLMVNFFKPGAGVDPARAQEMVAQGANGAGSILERTATTPTGTEALLNIVPTNIVAAMSANDVLAIMFFALFFGIGMLLAGERKEVHVLKAAIEGVFEVSMRLIGLVIRMAPIAVFCFMFNLAALFGWELLNALWKYALVVVGALGVQMFVVFPILLLLLARKSPLAFFRETSPASVMAFSTASSNATLPTSLQVAERNLKLHPRVSRFVLTIGATANQNGTAMFEGVTVIFLAQLLSVPLDFQQQLMVMAVCILGGIGTAGVPAGSLPVIAMILAMVGVPAEAIGLVLGVDRFLDMCRTVLNVIGDLVLATIVSAREEGEPVAASAAAPVEPPSSLQSSL